MWWRTYRQTIKIPPLTEHHRRYLEDVGALLELPRATIEALLPVYNSLLDDLIPIMDGSSVLRDFSNGQASRYLLRAICLVTCKAKQAAPFLRLTDDGPLLSHQVFASKLLDGLDAAIKANLESNRVIKIQILALMHLHNDGRGGVDRSSMYLTQAIREAWSMSLHLKMPENSDEDLDYLWWSLRNFDRLNKPTMGAGPFIIDDTDISINRIAPRRESYRSQVLHISLVLGDLTVKATKVYKASSISTVDDSFLEIWYHLAAMLSCRHSGPENIHYTRRLASADRILEMLAHGQHEALPPLPLVPYAMAMATTVIYRALRDRVRDIDTSSKDLSLCCEALDTLGQSWTTAQGVAKLAHRLMSSSNLGSIRQRVEAPARSDSTTSTGPTDERSLITTHPPINQSVGTEEVVIPTPVSLPSEQGFHGDHTSDNPPYLSEQLIEPWVGFDASQFQLQMAFDDLFSHGISDVFRDPASWELLHMANNGSNLGI
ncbi:hypothetical protein CEP51_006527 [Fusarium floridanum]|uniref:Transcription factor domain-containing protein n=1 Tax=Fusarium floridanum TaxID=1325733 RepID=A0A428RSG6_9HYPO|nr:hypothetical protein CEP51_006527 [Fusarium floridanum]